MLLMLVNKCDVCGAIKEHMEKFVVPMYGFCTKEYMNENGFGVKIEKGIYPFAVHLCPVCQKKIADYIESIRATISLD